MADNQERVTKVHSDYTVGWICALSKEQTAATALLDKRHSDLPNPERDSNTYTLGSIGGHNIVIACLPIGRYGTNAAANVVTLLAGTFPSVKSCLMVGIGGGIPKNKVQLGDVVVGIPGGQHPGVVQWDMGKFKQGGQFERTGSLDNPPKSFLTALAKLITENELYGSKIPTYLERFKVQYPNTAKKYLKSDLHVDILYEASYDHIPLKTRTERKDKGNSGDAENEEEESEDDSEEESNDDPCRLCDKSQVVQRKPRDMLVHYGLIASGNQLIKDAKTRDKLNKDLGGKVLCVEMEAAGIVNNFPCFVIRGICDYADSHKNEIWQEYAAIVAAAYAKELLSLVQPSEVQRDSPIKDILHQAVQDVNYKIEQFEKAVDSEFRDAKSELASLRTDAAARNKDGILQWLSEIEYADQQSTYITTRGAGTGEQMLRSPEFTAWFEGAGQTLFCPGIPGAGKTIQTSIVVEYLINSFKNDSKVAIAYQYYNFKQKQDQRAENLTANLIKQLARSRISLPDSVKSLHERFTRTNQRPSQSELLNTLQSVISSYSRVFIVLDALDECDDEDGDRTRLLDGLFDIQNNTRINLLASSRVVENIEGRFLGHPSFTIHPSQGDVFLFLSNYILEKIKNDQLPDFVRENQDLQSEIKEEIENAIDGVFLLARLYLDSLEGKRSVKALRDALNGLRKASSVRRGEQSALDEAYEKAMKRIQRQNGDLPEDAMLILSWIVNAREQPTVQQLQEALAVDVGKPELDKTNIPSGAYINRACAPLVVIDEKNNIIRLVHYTAQTYLERTQDEWFRSGQADITRRLVTYLSFTAFEGISARDFWKRIRPYELYEYAAKNWGHHAQEAFHRGLEAPELLDFLESEEKREIASLLIMKPFEGSSVIEGGPKKVSALHIAAFFGLYGVVELLLVRGHTVKARDTQNHTPLWWAARRGHLSVVKLLCEKGAEINIKDNQYLQTPLWWAATNNHIRVVEILIERNADLESKNSSGLTPLASATTNGNTAAVKLLLAEGALTDPDHKPRSRGRYRPFPESSRSFSEDESLWREDAPLKPSCPLITAATKGYEEIARLLLMSKAEVNAEDGWGLTPLAWAAMKGHCPLTELLLNHKANVNAQDNTKNTVLHLAACKGHSEVVSLLLKHGADVGPQNVGDGTALAAAVEGGYKMIVTQLLQKKAKVNFRYHLFQRRTVERYSNTIKGHVKYVAPIQHKWGIPWDETAGHRYYTTDEPGESSEWIKRRQVSPLWRAAEKEDDEMVKLLIKSGAKLDFAPGFTPCPEIPLEKHEVDSKRSIENNHLLRASKHGKLMVVKLLIEQGDDVTVTAECGRDALSLAAGEGYRKIVSILMAKNDVDPDRRDKHGRTPLSYAVVHGDLDTVKVLLNSEKVDPNSKDNDGRTPLSHAAGSSENSSNSVLQFLLSSAKVNPDCKDNTGRPPLSYCSRKSDIELFLASKTVDIDSKDNIGRTPLSYVAENGYVEAVRVLLKYGANRALKDNLDSTPFAWAQKALDTEKNRYYRDWQKEIGLEEVLQELENQVI